MGVCDVKPYYCTMCVLNHYTHTLLFCGRYARLHGVMCMPNTQGMDVELTSDLVNAELAQWYIQSL